MNLCRLELMKIRLSTYLWAILGIFASLLALGILFLFIFQIEAGGSGRTVCELEWIIGTDNCFSVCLL